MMGDPLAHPEISATAASVGALAPHAAWMTDLRGRVRYVNEYWCRYTGRSAAQTMLDGWAESLRPEGREATFTEFMRSAMEGGEYEVEFKLRRHDGAYRWFIARALPLRGEDGALVGWTGVAFDLHERKLALETAQRVSAAKDEFLAKLSHELRTPLSPAMMAVQLLAENPSLDAEAHDDLRMLARNLDTEARLIDDLLDVTRILHGKLPLRRTACDLHVIARDALRVCEAGIVSKKIAVLDLLANEAALLHADATRLQQVVWNLLANAIKFTPEGGTIALTSSIVENARVRLAVRDSGLGIDPARIASLFDAFEQGDGMITRNFGGLGLGLSICKGIVELHGGRIGATSAGLGTGAEFFFELPLGRG